MMRYENERRIVWRERLDRPGALHLESVVDMLSLRDTRIHDLEELVHELTSRDTAQRKDLTIMGDLMTPDEVRDPRRQLEFESIFAQNHFNRLCHGYLTLWYHNEK